MQHHLLSLVAALCVSVCEPTSQRQVRVLLGVSQLLFNYRFNLEDCLEENTMRLIFLSLSPSAPVAFLKGAKQQRKPLLNLREAGNSCEKTKTS